MAARTSSGCVFDFTAICSPAPRKFSSTSALNLSLRAFKLPSEARKFSEVSLSIIPKGQNSLKQTNLNRTEATRRQQRRTQRERGSEVELEPGWKSRTHRRSMAKGVPAAAAAVTSEEAATAAYEKAIAQQTEMGRPGMFTTSDYTPPPWASNLELIPKSFTALGTFPTPIHRWNLPGLPSGTEVWIKRDDLTGMQLSGNKVRKLEFLIADAKEKGADCVVTIGGIQSNHCRATAVAARYVGLDSYLILRTSRTIVDADPGLTGNLLVERMVGASIHLVTKEEYVKLGSETLGSILIEKLKKEGRKPYFIPVGGSNSLGSWGYLEGMRELEKQLQQGMVPGVSSFDDIVMACGSGGTTAGIGFSSHVSSLKSKVHAYAVCDSEEYFYDFTQGLLDGMGAGVSSREILRVKLAKGQGYAISTAEELKVVKDVAETTGVILDPVYSGKAIFGLLKDFQEDPKHWEGRKILFIHTGGLLGMYDKMDQLQPLLDPGLQQRLPITDAVLQQGAGQGKMF